ncbi:MAG: rRNA pseudouridine synthase [Planctomycetota bacterium]|nr:MAG: rRNA pseudouridine synthase [Planctomycetota bacterium]
MKAFPQPKPERDSDGATVRLNKWLADQGVASRRKCDELIASGHVSVDGETVRELGTKVDPVASRVEVDGSPVGARPVRKKYYLLNKPRGVFCTSDVLENRPRAIDLIDDRDKGRIYSVGRLDEDTTGVLLLTNDGELANRVMHPRYGVPKTYLVKLPGFVPDDALQSVRQGVRLAEGVTGGARVVVLKRTEKLSQLEVTINEGVNREVRRIFAAVGHKVARLHRSRLGSLNDRGLKIGSWRPLRRDEIDALLDPATSGAENPRLERLQKKRGPGQRFRRGARKGGSDARRDGASRGGEGAGRGGDRAGRGGDGASRGSGGAGRGGAGRGGARSRFGGGRRA